MLSGMLLKTSDVTKNVLIRIIRKLEHLVLTQLGLGLDFDFT